MLYKQPESKVQYEKFTEEDYLPFKHPGFATLAIHVGSEPEPIHGSVNVPIHLTSTYAQKDIAQPYGKFDYTRGGNPTREALEKCLAAVEYGTHAITFASGCGATATILHTLKQGDHIIVCDDVYGGTQRYMRRFFSEKHGIETEFIDITLVENVEKAIKPNTKLVWIETPTNPTLKLIDIDAVSKAVKAADPNIIILVDNTFPSPYLSSPLLLGADIVYHSLTKYVGGHSDIVMGAAIFKDKELHDKVYFAAYSLGANPSPFDCYLAIRGLKTLELRVIQSTRSAYHIAHFLDKNENIDSTIYPGLKTNKYYEVARKQMRGFGGMISFRIKGGKPQVSKFLKALNIFILAESLGGVESLAQCPAFMTHASVPAEMRAILGITDNLVRISVGVESLEDLIEDLAQALDASQKAD
jgi:cystathionine gamma-lyase